MTTQTGREPEAPEPVSAVLDAGTLNRELGLIVGCPTSPKPHQDRIERSHESLRAELATAWEERDEAGRQLTVAATELYELRSEADALESNLRTAREENERLSQHGMVPDEYAVELEARAERAEAALAELQTEAEKEIREQAEILEEACHVANTGWENAEAALERYRTTYRDAIDCSPGCGTLAWTIEKWGRVVHKHGCSNRRSCQTHPGGCPDTEATYRDAAQAHHEWAADPIYGCEHCARVTAALENATQTDWAGQPNMYGGDLSDSFDGDCCYGNYDDAHYHGQEIGRVRLAKQMLPLATGASTEEGAALAAQDEGK